MFPCYINNASEIFTTNAINGIISVNKVEGQLFSEFGIANKLQAIARFNFYTNGSKQKRNALNGTFLFMM